MNEAERAKELSKRQKRSKEVYVEADDAEPFLIYGYVGQNKGIYQVLYERGLYKLKMQGRQTQGTKERLEMQGKYGKILPSELDAHAVLEKCTDFNFERTALQNVVESRGHILLPSVVCTPETAGGEIEYAWGKLKFEQRKENNSAVKLESGAKFHERVERLCKNKGILPMIRVLKFQRRARDYIRLYIAIGERRDGSAPLYIDIERMRSKQSTHRNIM